MGSLEGKKQTLGCCAMNPQVHPRVVCSVSRCRGAGDPCQGFLRLPHVELHLVLRASIRHTRPTRCRIGEITSCLKLGVLVRLGDGHFESHLGRFGQEFDSSHCHIGSFLFAVCVQSRLLPLPIREEGVARHVIRGEKRKEPKGADLGPVWALGINLRTVLN